MFDEKKSLVAFNRLMKSLKGKRASKVSFEAHLNDGEVLEFKSKKVKETVGGNVLFMRRRRKKESA